MRLILLLLLTGCATVPVVDEDSERIEAAQAGDANIPDGVPYVGGKLASGGFTYSLSSGGGHFRIGGRR